MNKTQTPADLRVALDVALDVVADARAADARTHDARSALADALAADARARTLADALDGVARALNIVLVAVARDDAAEAED